MGADGRRLIAACAAVLAVVGSVVAVARGSEPPVVTALVLPDRVVPPPAAPTLPSRRPSVPGDSTEAAVVAGRVPGRPSPPVLPTIPASAAGVLRAAGLPALTAVEPAHLAQAAGLLGVPVGDRLDQPVVDRILLAARQTLGPVLRAAGLDHGTVVDDGDLARAGRVLGVDVGFVVDPADVDRLVSAARARLAPVLWAAGGDHGAVVDDGDLRRAAARLGLDVGAVVDPADVTRAVIRGREILTRTGTQEVAPGLTLDRWRLRLAEGPVRLSVLRWRLDDPRVVARTEAATRLGARATVPDIHASRLPAGALATVNGGFWVDQGDPDGLLVTDGVLRSDPSTGRSWVRGRRGAFGLAGDRPLVGRPSWRGELHAPDGTKLEIRGVNRPLRSADDVVVWTSDVTTVTESPAGTLEVPVAGFVPVGLGDGSVVLGTASTAGATPVPSGGSVIAASGRPAAWLRAHAGATVRASANPDPGWQTLDQGLGGGPLLVAGNRLTSQQEWESEGFGAGHTLGRHPRTAIGFTSDREALLVVADGRQPGRSIGLSVPETARMLRAVGAVDAVMLDGGGSSHLVVGDHTANVPCCDRRPRPVATALVLYAGG